MTKLITIYAMTAVLLIISFAYLATATAAFADARDSLRGITVSPPPSPFAPALQPAPSNSGGINNTTSGEVDSGGNSGINVVTGDESVDVHVKNEGPTNSNTVVSNKGATPPAPEPSCEPSRTVRCDSTERNR